MDEVSSLSVPESGFENLTKTEMRFAKSLGAVLAAEWSSLSSETEASNAHRDDGRPETPLQ